MSTPAPSPEELRRRGLIEVSNTIADIVTDVMGEHVILSKRYDIADRSIAAVLAVPAIRRALAITEAVDAEMDLDYPGTSTITGRVHDGLLLRLRAADQSTPAPKGGDMSGYGDGPCDECGGINTAVWATDNTLWNLVQGGEYTLDDPGGVLCIPCFIAKAEMVIDPQSWRLTPVYPIRKRWPTIWPSRPAGSSTEPEKP